MSKQIDERIVSMQFDNRNFEKNVHTSMSTIDKLKQKLNFSGASKGLDNLNSAAKKVDVSGLSNGVEAVRAKFSALEVMGVTALANITNSAVNAGKRIVSALTIDPVKTGFEEYETQINAIQTILANTQKEGTNVEQVNAALDELNYYADKTIYNFTEMTRNIGTFTAAGVDLKTSVSAIQGIANLAAVSGSTSIQASTAMYQLSQALAAGKVSLMDWNSVVNAGMGGQVFQDALRETSTLLKTGAEEAIEANGSFRESLQEGWLTAEVLTATLNKFTTSGANEYVAEYTGLSKDAVEAAIKSAEAQYGEADAIEYASKALAEKSGKSADEIKSVLNMAKTAEEAATKVKTFSQLWDTLKEAVQSGWGQTWRLIIGDFDQAKELFTRLSDFFGGVIGGISDFRNNLLAGALSNPFTDFIDKLNSSTIGKVAEKIESVTTSLEEYQKVVNDVWRGDYKTSDTGRFEMLEKAGYNHKVVQDLVNKGYQYKLTIEDIEESERKFGVSIDKTSESVEETAQSFENLSDEQLKNAGLTEDEIKMYRDLEKQSKKTGKSIQELVDEISNKDGRTLLLESFENAGKGIVSIITAIKDAWLDVFPPPTVMQLYNVISGLNEFSKKLVLSEETADKLKRTFKGLFSIIHVISTIVGGVLNTAFKIAKQVLGAFNLDILDVTASIGDALVKFDEWFSSIFDFTELIKKAVPYIQDITKAISDWAKGIKDADNIPKYIVQGLVNGLKEGVKLVGTAAIELGKAIVEKIKSFLGIHSPSTTFIEIGRNIISGLVIGIQNGVSAVWETLKNMLAKGVEIIKNINWGTVIAGGLTVGVLYSVIQFAKALNKLASPIEGIGEVLEGFGKTLSGFGKYLKGLAFSVKVNAIKNLVLAISLLIGAVILLTFIDPKKLWTAVGVLAAIVGILAALVLAMHGLAALGSKMGSGAVKFSAISLGLIGMAASILILAKVVKSVSELNPDKAKQGFIGLAGLIGAMIVALAAYGLLVRGKAAQNIDKAGKTFLKFSVSLLILVGVIKLLANMTTNELTRGLITIGVLELFLIALIAVSKIAGKDSSKMGSMLLKVSVALLILVGVIKLISMMSWDEIKKGALGLAGFAAFILALVLITKLGGKTAPKIGGMLLSIAVAMLIMVGIIKLISGMEWEDLAKGLVGIVVLGLIIAGLVAIVVGLGKDAPKIGVTLLALAVAIGILAGVAVLLGMVNVENLAKGLAAVGVLALLMALMVRSTKGASSVVGTIVALTVAVALLATALVALSFVDGTKLLTSAAALTLVMLAFAAMTLAAGTLKDTDKILSKLLPLVGVVALLAVILGLMSVLDVEASIQSAIALGVLLAAMAVSMLILSQAKEVSKAMMGNMAIMALVVGELAVILGIMDALDVEASIPTVIALGIMLNAMAAAMLILDQVKDVSKSMMGNMAIMALVVGELAVILGLMDAFDVEASITTVIALSIMLNAMAAAMLILDQVKDVSKSMVGNMAIMALVVGELAVILGIMDALDVEASIPTALALGILLNAMAAAMLILDQVKHVDNSVVGTMALLGLVVGELAVILGVMDAFDVEPSIETALALSILLGAMSGSLLILSAVGVVAGAALAGVGVLAAAITAIGGLLIAIGALLTEFPGAEEFLDRGLPLLEKIGTGIGNFFGDMVTGFIDKASESIPILGTRLSEFMVNLQPFVMLSKLIDQSVVDGVKAIAEAVLIITAANILDGISRFFNFGKSGIETFAEQLPVLGKGMKGFADELGDFTPTQVLIFSAAANALKALAEAADAIPNSGGFIGKIVGNNDIGTFAGQFEGVGSGLSSLVTSLGDFGEGQVETIKHACDAIIILAETADKIPNEGGLAGAIFGENGIGAFADQFASVGEGLNNLVTNLGDFNEANVKTIKSACSAIIEIAKAAKVIPNEGGLMGDIFGDNGIAAFSGELLITGACLTSFVTVLGEFGEAQVEVVRCAASAIVEMSKAASGINGQADWAKKIFGDNGIAAFSSEFPTLGTNLRSFVSNLGTFGNAQITTTASAVKAINALAGLANSDLKGAKKNLEGFGDKIVQLAKDIASFVKGMPETSSLDTAIKNVGKILKMIDDISGADANIATNFTKSLRDIGKKGVKSFVDAFTSSEAKTDVKKAAVDLMGELISGFESKVEDIKTACKDAAIDGKDAIREKYDDFKDAGKYLVSGFADGISANSYQAEAKARAMALAAKKAAEKALDINSPSKVGYSIGDFFGQGFVNAIDDYADKSYSASSDMASSARQGLSDSIGKIRDLIESDVDAQPTIRPVLDLSNVQTGVGAMRSLLDSNSSVDVTSRVGSINSMMNRKIQNGKNGDVISAIDKLRKDLGSSTGNTYTINGITYDDGSNISNAVKELVRAARVERRM